MKISDEGDASYVVCYCYRTTSKDYSTYCHDVKETRQQLEKQRNGLLKASRDCGLLLACGCPPVNIIPSYHTNIGSDRRWLAIPSVLGYELPQSIMKYEGFNHRIHYHLDFPCTGRLTNWDTSATEKSDLRLSGLADIADFDMSFDMKTYFSRSDDTKRRNLDLVTQKAAVANNIAENLLGIIVSFARCSHNSDDYHYQNDSTVKDIALFIEESCQAYLCGLFGKDILLRDILELDDSGYQRWLNDTAKYLVFWTTKLTMPSGNMAELPVTSFFSPFDRNENSYAFSLENRRPLPDSLYTEEDRYRTFPYADGIGGELQEGILVKYHSDFPKEASLGVINGSFPVRSLMSGLTRLSDGCIKLLYQ